METMTAAELIELLRTANPRALVVFLPWGADEGQAEEVGAVAVLKQKWTRERLTEKGRLYESLYPGEPREELRTESENIAVDSVAVVVLASDAAFLNSRRFT
ncbi:hypothetical protein [Caballeronia sp. SBC2]|uniref:hypothetical protein n=1 Tax=Caballeronia sp. SBC2 TaxID=2705547 RepID=UPI0013EA0BA3|nr:hypothetical protein [Caballeronia sp. SBC2]